MKHLRQEFAENIPVQIALNGMHRAIGTALSTHAPKTLNELKKLTFRVGSIRHSDTTDTFEIGIHQTWGQLL